MDQLIRPKHQNCAFISHDLVTQLPLPPWNYQPPSLTLMNRPVSGASVEKPAAKTGMTSGGTFSAAKCGVKGHAKEDRGSVWESGVTAGKRQQAL